MAETQNNIGRHQRRACAQHPDELLPSQIKAIDLVLSGMKDALKRATKAATLLEPTDRPNQVYLVDGGRGAGKTFTLLTMQRAINSLMLDSEHEERKLWAPHTDRVAAGSGFKAQVLRIIFPGEFTEGEMLMEHIFAEMLDRLVEDEKRYREGPEKERDPFMEAKARMLKERLLKDVAQGWYFAKRFGFEAVVRDAINYEDLVENWSEESGKASRRIDKWREFVTEWLDFSKAQMLIILLDDSDNDESLTDNILHSLRLVLDHPQIVTVLAGNLTAMRESLIHLRMKRIAPSVSALSGGRSPAAKEWRRRLRREVEEYLEKVIPQQQRAYLTVGRASTAAGSDDFQQIVGLPLAEMVESALQETRDRFLQAKFALALRHEAQQSDAATHDQQRRLETFLSWWLFGNLYGVELKPRSVRNLNTIRDYYGSDAGEADARWKKRLPVVLYGMSANFDLLQRLTDDDPSIVPWLRQQKLRSEWSQRRAFIINDRRLPRRDYGHAFLRYQLDIGLAMPFRDNPDQMVPGEMLPTPIGRRHLRRFFQPRQSPRRHRRLGLARWLDHAAIPSNCLYFHDLMALPDGAFIDVEQLPEANRQAEIEKLQTGRWESRLADEWLSTLEDDQETDADEYLARYFREIVCETLRGTHIIPSGELLNLMDPPDIKQKQTRAIYEHFLADELKSFDIAFGDRAAGFRALIRSRYRRGETGRPAGPLDPIENPDRMIALYTSLASDLRRGWHSIRIHQVAPKVIGQVAGESGEQEVHAIVATKDRLRLYKSGSIRDELMADDWVKRVLSGLEKEELREYFGLYFDDIAKEKIKIRRNVKFLRRYVESKTAKIAGTKPGGPRELTLLRELARVFHHSGLLQVKGLRTSKEIDPFADDASIDALVVADPRGWRKWALGLAGMLRPMEGADNKEAREVAVAQARFRLYLRKVDIVRLFEARESLAGEPQVQEESESFDVWMWTLRNVARFLCKDWPFHDSMLWGDPAQLPYPPFEDENPPLLKIRQPTSPEEPADDERERKREARSARNFSLLMYGLAPSLPAMIHANVMSRVYEAKLRLAGVRQQAYSGPETGRSIVAGSLALIREAIDEADEWAYLIGQLSVLLRVVKIKALHLDLRLLIEASDADGELDDAATIFAQAVRRSRRAAEALRGMQNDKLGREMLDTCREMLGVPERNAVGKWQLIKGLAIFPDMASSTLFGEGWIGDLISRQAFLDELAKRQSKEPKEDPREKDREVWAADRSNPERTIRESSLSVTGAFGETEQWLWAANRSLRKLREQIVKDAAALIPGNVEFRNFLDEQHQPAHLSQNDHSLEQRAEERRKQFAGFAAKMKLGAVREPAATRQRAAPPGK